MNIFLFCFKNIKKKKSGKIERSLILCFFLLLGLHRLLLFLLGLHRFLFLLLGLRRLLLVILLIVILLSIILSLGFGSTIILFLFILLCVLGGRLGGRLGSRLRFYCLKDKKKRHTLRRSSRNTILHSSSITSLITMSIEERIRFGVLVSLTVLTNLLYYFFILITIKHLSVIDTISREDTRAT